MIRILLTTTFLLFAHSQASISPKDLYEENFPLEMTIVAPLAAIQEDRSLEDSEYRKAWVLMKRENTVDSLRAQVCVRGNFRRQPQVCEWPPLKLKVKKKDAGSYYLGPHRKFKLVTNCQGENILMKEYAVYRLYQQLTPESFHVRLVKLTIRDSEGMAEDTQQLGFLIEDKDDVAERLDLTRQEEPGAVPSLLDLEDRARLYLFQYMIGNRDWDMAMEKNIAVFLGESNPVAIPFDFDFSGCVAAPYSGLGDYELRHWRKLCWDSELQEKMRQEFVTMIPQWESMLTSLKQLPKADRKSMLRYFRPVFKAAEHADTWAELFPAVCE